jgi:hypothetical protein
VNIQFGDRDNNLEKPNDLASRILILLRGELVMVSPVHKGKKIELAH